MERMESWMCGFTGQRPRFTLKRAQKQELRKKRNYLKISLELKQKTRLTHCVNKTYKHMIKSNKKQAGIGYMGGSSTIEITPLREAMLKAIPYAKFDRNQLLAHFGSADKVESYIQWRLGGSSVLTSTAKTLNW